LAIGAAIDGAVLAENIIKNGSKAPTGFTPDAVTGLEKPFPEEVGQTIIGYYVEKAKELYEQAVAELGEIPPLTIITDDNDTANKVCGSVLDAKIDLIRVHLSLVRIMHTSRVIRMRDKE